MFAEVAIIGLGWRPDEVHRDMIDEISHYFSDNARLALVGAAIHNDTAVQEDVMVGLRELHLGSVAE